MPDEIDHLNVGQGRRLTHSRIGQQELPAATAIPDDQFAVNEIVPKHFIVSEEPVEFMGVGLFPGEKANPDRGVNKDHYALRRLREGTDLFRSGTAAQGAIGGLQPPREVGLAWLRDQLDIDSYDFLNVVVALHERLGVEIPEADYQKLLTLNGEVDYLAGKSGAN